MADYGRKPTIIPNYSVQALEQTLERLDSDNNEIEAAIAGHTKTLNDLVERRNVVLAHRAQTMTAIVILKKEKP